MAIPVRRATDDDATWARAWTAATFADLANIPDETWSIGPRHGDVAYVTDEDRWYTWRDTDTWELSGNTSGDHVPLSLGVEPGQIVTNGAGGFIFVDY